MTRSRSYLFTSVGCRNRFVRIIHHTSRFPVLTANLDAHENATLPDYYAVLAIPRTSSFAEIKLAYHRVLLISHPDKQRSNGNAPPQQHPPVDGDIGLIKQAYATLSNTETRAKYDASVAKIPAGPRPAQIVSLEEFDEAEVEDGAMASWWYRCRCGGRYQITEADMEQGQHVMGCSSCSEVVWVGYELVDADPND